MEKKHNPDSHKRLRLLESSNYWPQLPQDLFNSVFKRLGFADFRRAESVCSSWYSAVRRCGTRNQIPWLILFPDEDDDDTNHSCTLFNPEEKGRLYKRQNLGVGFAKSVCLATYGSWVFMCDVEYNFYIVNLFTKERMDLPHVESQLGTTKLERISDDWFRISNLDGEERKSEGINIVSPVFWIDAKTKDYVAVWGFGIWCVAYTKKGDQFWSQIPSCCFHSDMVYKNHMLYLLDFYGSIKIFDFSQEIPQQTFQCGVQVNTRQLPRRRDSWRTFATKLVATVTGDVLKVEKNLKPVSGVWSFRLYKVYSSGVFMNYEQVDSLGHEAMLFDLGITVLANDIEGFKPNSIYSNNLCRINNTTEICLFNLDTQKMEPMLKFDCSSAQQLARARWFLPSFTQA